MDFALSANSAQWLGRVQAFIQEHIVPLEVAYLAENRRLNWGADWNCWQLLPEIDELKQRARREGLWNLFLPDVMSTLDYAPLAEAMGHSLMAPEIFNCNAPDSGNMEVLHHYGTPEQQARWLQPLLAGEIRSVFCMTEPEVASSDATNMRASIEEDGPELVLNGHKWWATGLGHPRAQLLIFMGLSNPNAEKHRRHSMVLVPLDTPGVRIERMLPTFGEFDPPYGHGQLSFEGVRVPRSSVLCGLGEGFAIAQGRLGPGRIHHCMRCLGAAEQALKLLIRRGMERHAFGKTLLDLGGNLERVAELRMAIDQARLLTLHAAWKIDQAGVKSALSEIAAIKVVVPNVLQRVCDEAIQMHGAAGLSHDFPLTAFFIQARALRLADGPDAVHRATVARHELAKHRT